MAPNITHYNVDVSDDKKVRVHFNNIDPDKEENGFKAGFAGLATTTAEAAKHAKEQLKTTSSFYRKMRAEEVSKSIANKGLVGQIKGTNSRKYVTDSLDKAVNFTNKGITPDQQLSSKILEMKVDKKYAESFKDGCIVQKNASKINPSANVYNTEGFTNSSNANYGIHGENLPEFNRNVKDVLVLNPQDATVKNKFLRYLSTHKLEVCLTTIAVVIEGYNIYVAICKDGGIGKHTVIHCGGLVGSQIGSKVGAVIGSLVPGLGTVVGCFIGGMIGSFLGSKLAEFFWCFFTSSGDDDGGYGGPPPQFISLIFGTPDCAFLNVIETVKLENVEKKKAITMTQKIAIQQKHEPIKSYIAPLKKKEEEQGWLGWFGSFLPSWAEEKKLTDTNLLTN